MPGPASAFMKTPIAGVLATVALGALTIGCGGVADPATAYLPPGPTVVEVAEHHLGYVLERTEIPQGRAVFRVVNSSGLDHDLSLVVLPEDLPPIVEQLRGSDRRAVDTLARLPSRSPGSSDAFAVDLVPGRYALLCFETDGGHEPHALRGMAMEFRVVSSEEQP